MITDPVSDLFTRIRNSALTGSAEVSLPYSRLKNDIVDVLKKEGYVADYKKVENGLVINLTFKRRKPIITGIRSVSKPGRRIYRKAGQLPRPLGGAGISIISTPQGVLSNKEAYKKKLGGEVLGEVW